MLVNTHRYPAFEPRHPNYEFQQQAFDWAKDREYYGLLWEQGLGKSKAMIDNFCWLFRQQEIDGVFIVAPKGAYLSWIMDELPTHLPTWLPIRIAYWEADWTQRERQKAEELLQAKDDLLDIFVMNIEALVTDRAVLFAEQFIKAHHTFGIVDESSCIKNPKAVRTKAITRLGLWMEYRRILSGTPLTKGPLDIYAQAEFLKKGLSGFHSFHTFENYYAVTRQITSGTRSFKKILGYVNMPELQRRIATFADRKLKKECLDLPEKIFLTKYVEHTREQSKLYDQLKEEALLEFSDESMVTSTSVLTTMMKLHQINCGHVMDDFGNIIQIPHNRIKVLMEILEDCDSKVIVWCHFKEDVRQVTAAISEEYGDMSVVHYYGDTNLDDRKIHLERFKRDPSCRFFVSNRTGSKGLTLVESNCSVYYSYSYDLETWLQSQDRNHRIGQRDDVTYTTLVTPKTIDVGISKNLHNKIDLISEVLDKWRTML